MSVRTLSLFPRSSDPVDEKGEVLGPRRGVRRRQGMTSNMTPVTPPGSSSRPPRLRQPHRNLGVIKPSALSTPTKPPMSTRRDLCLRPVDRPMSKPLYRDAYLSPPTFHLFLILLTPTHLTSNYLDSFNSSTVSTLTDPPRPKTHCDLRPTTHHDPRLTTHTPVQSTVPAGTFHVDSSSLTPTSRPEWGRTPHHLGVRTRAHVRVSMVEGGVVVGEVVVGPLTVVFLLHVTLTLSVCTVDTLPVLGVGPGSSLRPRPVGAPGTGRAGTVGFLQSHPLRRPIVGPGARW